MTNFHYYLQIEIFPLLLIGSDNNIQWTITKLYKLIGITIYQSWICKMKFLIESQQTDRYWTPHGTIIQKSQTIQTSQCVHSYR